MRRLNLLAFLVLGSIVCSAQELRDPDREAFALKLFVNDSNFYQSDIAAGPYFVKEGIIQIYPGEKLYVEAKVKHGELHDMRVVSLPKDTTKVIHIELKQYAKDRQHEQMMLYVWNPFEGDLHYEALVFYMEHAQWAKTSALQVRSRLGAYETWPDVIVTMALSDWKLTVGK